MGGDRASQARCPSCESELRAGDRFCSRCGTQVATMRSEAERRLITVAFFDMVGSTPIAERMDPEEFRELVLRYQDICVRAIERHRGYVADYRGDAILAYFGYPVALEDDAARAVRAALAAARDIGAETGDLQLRVGLHTGLVVVGEMGAGTRRKHDVVTGDTPNVAARIQSVAGPNQVVMSEDTAGLAPGFVTKDLGAPELKGISRRLRLFRAIEPSGVPVSGRWSPFVARTDEVDRLEEAFSRASAGTGTVAIIRGEPGIGKSRVLVALRERLASTSHAWIHLLANRSDRLSPLKPVIDTLIHPSVLPEDGDDDTQLLRSLVGLPARDAAMPTSIRRRRLLDAVARLIRARAAHRPLVFAVEDVHWLDQTTSDLLAHLATGIATHRMLLLGTTRGPEPAWPDDVPRLEVDLSRLPPRAATDLARSIAGTELGDTVIADIVARTDGIPLFIEELTRSIVEGGTASIPASLQQSITSRLDHLGDARELAQVAAVVGRTFDTTLLAAVLDREEDDVTADLATALASGLVEPDNGARDGAWYRFRHSLVRDIAYDSLLRASRKDLHAKVARAFADHTPDIVRTQPEVVAVHHHLAGEITAAVEHWTKAAQGASDRFALAEGIEHATNAVDAIRELEPSEQRDRWEQGVLLLLMRLVVQSSGPHDPRMEQIFLRASELTASRSEDDLERYMARAGLCAFYIGHARHREAGELADELMQVSERSDLRLFRLFAHAWTGEVQYHRGALTDSLRSQDATIAVYERQTDAPISEMLGFDVGVSALLHASYAHWYLGEPDRAAATMHDAASLADELTFSFPACHVLVGWSILHALDDRPADARRFAERAIEMATEHEWSLMSDQAAFARGRADWLDGHPDDAVHAIGRAVDALLAPGGFGGATIGLAWLAEAQLDAGDPDTAAATIDRARAFVETSGECFFEPELWRVHARILVALGADDDAAAALRRAIEVARSQSNAGLLRRAERDLRQGPAGA